MLVRIDDPLSDWLNPNKIINKAPKGCVQLRDLEGANNMNPWRPKLFFHIVTHSSCVLGYEGWKITKQILCGVNMSIFCHNPNPHSTQRWPIIYQWQPSTMAQWICDIVNHAQPMAMLAFIFIPSKFNWGVFDIQLVNEHPTLVVQWGHPNSTVRDNLVTTHATNWYLREIGLSSNP